MDPKIKMLAEQAGFCVWSDEEWNPGDVIDWSCSYDEQLIKFYELAREQFLVEMMKEAVNENRY